MAGAEVIDQVLTDSAEDCLNAHGVPKTALEKDAESWSDYWGSRLQDFAVRVTSQPTSIGAAEQSGLKFGTLTEVPRDLASPCWKWAPSKSKAD